jgi:hypothetical protein
MTIDDWSEILWVKKGKCHEGLCENPIIFNLEFKNVMLSKYSIADKFNEKLECFVAYVNYCRRKVWEELFLKRCCGDSVSKSATMR